jgi:hypothetical protein
MTEPQNILAIEPTSPIPFGSVRSLRKHVRKHVLRDGGQRWTELINFMQLDEAQREIDEDLPDKPMLQQTMDDYSRVISESLLRLTSNDMGHMHLFEESGFRSKNIKQKCSEGLPNGAVQTIEALDIEEKIVIIAKSFVQKGEFTPYVLCTGYRPYSKLSDYSLSKEFERRFWERRTLRRECGDCKEIVLARHDK